MKIKIPFCFLFAFYLSINIAFAQQNVVISDPTENAKSSVKATTVEENLIKNSVLPQARKYWTSDVCSEDFSISGVAKGAFSKPGAKQTLIFYAFCQTGNGFGNNGLVLLENNKIIGSYIAEGGWAIDLKALPDINQNGLDEFLVYYSGGMHQGEGGTGVDLLEFSASGIKALGWFQSDSYGERGGDYGYKVTTKPGKNPIFYREKYISVSESKWRKSGKILPLKLSAPIGKYSVLK